MGATPFSSSDVSAVNVADVRPDWTFRAARADDAAACAPLVYASGVKEFGFFLGASPDRCIAFLRFAFASRHGRFSWRRHRVATTRDDAVVGVLAAHDGRAIALDDPHVAWMLLRFFGVRRAIGCLLRGLVLESELPPPTRAQTLVAHCATDERVRGTGVFSALFDDALRVGMFGNGEGREVVLDVLVDNARAHALYRRLGLGDRVRAKPRSKRLPAGLESVRMGFDPADAG